MLIDKLLAVARAAVVMGGKRELGEVRGSPPPATAHGQFAFMGKSIFFSYQIHRLKELQPCEGGRPLQNYY